MYEITSRSQNADLEIAGKAVAYDKNDKKVLTEIYDKWVEMNELISKIDGKRTSIPSELIEGVVCLECGMWKVKNSLGRRFDLWDPNAENGKNRVEILVTTSALFSTMLSRTKLEEVDRILLVKLYFSKHSSLSYEIFDYDVEEILSRFPEQNRMSRIMIRYDDFRNMEYRKKYEGSL